jgi:hypothetical protein
MGLERRKDRFPTLTGRGFRPVGVLAVFDVGMPELGQRPEASPAVGLDISLKIDLDSLPHQLDILFPRHRPASIPPGLHRVTIADRRPGTAPSGMGFLRTSSQPLRDGIPPIQKGGKRLGPALSPARKAQVRNPLCSGVAGARGPGQLRASGIARSPASELTVSVRVRRRRRRDLRTSNHGERNLVGAPAAATDEGLPVCGAGIVADDEARPID